MKYKCIIFDCDGVLVDSETITSKVMIELAKEQGANITLDFALQNFAGKTLIEWFAFIEKKANKKLPDNFEAEFRNRTFKAFAEDIQAIKGVPELLNRINIPYCVASSGPANKIKLNLTTVGLINKFEGKIFSCYDIKIWKPNPAIFLHAAKEMGFTPSECVVIEDSSSGVKAAKAGGFDVYGLVNDHNKESLEKENIPLFNDMNKLDEILELNIDNRIQKNQSLKDCNTFGIDVNAKEFIRIREEDDLFNLLNKYNSSEIKILGGGSNLLLTQDINGIVIKNEIKGIAIVSEDENTVLLEIGGGENWHDFVIWAVDNNYGGVENMSLIPGTVGAAPIQNIGAYGVELKDVFEGLNAIHFEKKQEQVFSKEECKFGYRDSIFKKDLKGQICITRVYLRLSKIPHQLNLSYGAIQAELDKNTIENPTIKDISETVIAIRQSKLPDPVELGNSGSFFKNQEVSTTTFARLQEKFPAAPSYSLPNGKVKIPAAWLIDQCGFKGVKYGNTGCFKNQPLVLVNYGNATGAEILNFSKRVQTAVFEKFSIRISPEVNIW
jgi:UDP-N-acetylmuramate dehydrogenase